MGRINPCVCVRGCACMHSMGIDVCLCICVCDNIIASVYWMLTICQVCSEHCAVLTHSIFLTIYEHILLSHLTDREVVP